LHDESIRQLLKNFGLTDKEASTYMFISKHGAVRSIELARLTKTDKAEVYRILTGLQSKGIIEKTLEAPTRFTAVSFEKLVDSFIKNKRDEANIVEATKSDLLADWEKVTKQLPLSPLERFVVIKGWKKIYPRLFEMAKESQLEFSWMSTADSLLKAEQYGLLDVILNHPSREAIKFRFITEMSNSNTIAKLAKQYSHFVDIRSKNPEIGAKTSPKVIIKDEDEIVLFLNTYENAQEDYATEVALWTNCKTIVQSFKGLFDSSWGASKELIPQKNVRQTSVLKNQYTTGLTRKGYVEKLRNATNEILMVTSSEGLSKFCSKSSLVRQLVQRGVSIKIMAPIVSKNFSWAQKFSNLNIIRHVPENYVGITIIDGKELMQSRVPSSDKDSSDKTQRLTTDSDYVSKMRETLNDLWDNAQSPSAVTLENIADPILFPMPKSSRGFKRAGVSITDLRPPGEVTEQDIINKINLAKKRNIDDPAKDVNVFYGSAATAIVHPPPHFNLPDLLFVVQHIEKQSSFGEGDALEVHILLETPKGSEYIAAGGLGDNAKGVAYRKRTYAGMPFEHNYKLVKKDKLQVRVYGNNFFVGWTVPIFLLPPKYILPPGCLIFEGHGQVKTQAISTVSSSGYRSEVEQNWLEAFVTLMHPQFKYSGPGTDGAIFRDFVCSAFPPEQ
jgi:sugar-specific transcriptional regulator TrmB